MGMQIATAAVENNIEVPLKTKNRTTIWYSNPTPGHISEKTKFPKDICTPVFIAALSTIAKTWKQLLSEGMNKDVVHRQRITQPFKRMK